VGLLAVGADSDELLGSVGLIEVDLGQRRAEAGFWTAPWARRSGVASRALRLLARWSFEVLDLARVQAMPHRENEASQRALERAGFVREGLLRSYEEIKGERWDMALFSLLAEELGADTQSCSGN
jgi:RimJ/RimL family protein N-acetyltransferase